jgi:hypothetical protein
MAELVVSAWELKEGDLIFSEGDHWDGIYLVKSGFIEVFRSRRGKAIRLGVLGPGEFLGTVTLFTQGPRSASARAISDVSIQHFDAASIHKSFSQIPAGVSAIVKDILARLGHVNQELVQAKLDEGGGAGLAAATDGSSADKPWVAALRHLRQLVNLLRLVVPMELFEQDGRRLFRLEGLFLTAEGILALRATYIEALFNLLVTSSLLVVEEIPGHGLCLVNPSTAKLQALLEFSARPEEVEPVVSDASTLELLPAIRLLAELMATPGYGDVLDAGRLDPLFAKLFPEVPAEVTLAMLADLGYLSQSKNGNLLLACQKILRTTSFNAILKGLHTLTPARAE